MKEEPFIRLREVGKRYYMTTHSERTIFKSLRRLISEKEQFREVWALKGINLDIHHGERLGIIGRNGAGKTTLLMVLAGIMTPTEGTVELGHAVRSPFLGLGTALQPELSVEDNIRLCGALLGLPPREMRDRLEAIIKFGELEPYRHARLLQLSSGFKMRVAFATALNADSDVVLIDESMAVGDVSFQQKCLDVFARYKEQGKTIIMTSHSLPAIREMCDRCIYVADGRIKAEGDPFDVTAAFEADLQAASH